MAVIKNKRILKCLLMMVVSLFLILNFSIGVSASGGYDRQEADACITISGRLSVKKVEKAQALNIFHHRITGGQVLRFLINLEIIRMEQNIK